MLRVKLYELSLTINIAYIYTDFISDKVRLIYLLNSEYCLNKKVLPVLAVGLFINLKQLLT